MEPELFHERGLAERVSLVRLMLCAANFVVLQVSIADGSNEIERTFPGWAPALCFLVYAVVILVALVRRTISLKLYEITSPFLDVFFSTLLIIATNAYDSPFNLWIVFSVVATGFSRYRFMPVVAAGLGLIAHAVIGAVPQPSPPDYAVFMVRTAYLVGFAAIVASLSAQLSRQSDVIAALERMGNQAATSANEEEAISALKSGVAAILPGDKVDILPPGPAAPNSIPLKAGTIEIGHLQIRRKRPVRSFEQRMITTMSDRVASAIARHRLSRELVESAAKEERLRMADELHDTYLQTLAAIDLRAEAARSVGPEAAAAELSEIKRIARSGAARAREFIQQQQAPLVHGPATLADLVRKRWEGTSAVEVDYEVQLSEARWNALELLVKEGMNNARRHGRAKAVWLKLHREGNEVVASLENDGSPYDPSAQYGYGLMRLTTAVESQGGALDIQKSPNGNMLLSARFKTVDHDTKPNR